MRGGGTTGGGGGGSALSSMSELAVRASREVYFMADTTAGFSTQGPTAASGGTLTALFTGGLTCTSVRSTSGTTAYYFMNSIRADEDAWIFGTVRATATADRRFRIGVYDRAAGAADVAAITNDAFGLYYDDGVHGTTKWRFETSDTSSVGEETATAVDVVSNTVFAIRKTATSIECWIGTDTSPPDLSAAADHTHTTRIPSGTDVSSIHASSKGIGGAPPVTDLGVAILRLIPDMGF